MPCPSTQISLCSMDRFYQLWLANFSEGPKLLWLRSSAEKAGFPRFARDENKITATSLRSPALLPLHVSRAEAEDGTSSVLL